MKDSILFLRIVFRTILQIVISVLLVFPTLYLMLGFFEAISRDIPLLRDTARLLYNQFGMTVLSYAIGFCFFLMYFVLLNVRRIRYHIQIYTALKRIAQGHFDQRVPVKYNHEFTDMAENMNQIVERLMASMQEERRSEQTKNELITNVSHDLRTPLTSILGYLGLIDQDRYRDEVELRYYVDIAYEKSQRLKLLIDDLFEYTRMRNGSANQLQLTRFNLIEMLGQLAAEFQVQFQSTGLENRLMFAENRILVNADANKMARVFENLIINALTYGSEGKAVDFAAWREGSYAHVEIINYGEPIPAIDLPHLFDRFYRVDKSRTEHSVGSGLGLAIAKNIIDLHGGMITVYSDAERTAFRVTLRAEDP